MILGYLTFTGSLMAAGKLQEIIPTRPITYRGQNVVNLGLLAIARGRERRAARSGPSCGSSSRSIIVLSLLFGVLLIMPIGGADMPTVISLLNSYAGLSAVAMGFVLENKVLITAGALDGSSGLILSVIMCRAMNRSFTNVLFGAFGQVQAAAAPPRRRRSRAARRGTRRTCSSNAAQGRHRSRATAWRSRRRSTASAKSTMQLTKRGIDVKFAIHPVAGPDARAHERAARRSRGARTTRSIEMDEINRDLPQTDVVLVVGANDVVNPAARHDTKSPIYGMPIIDADRAKFVIANKRSMNPGFAGIDNELYSADNTLMIFGDAKTVLGEVVKALTGGGGH